MCTVHIEDRSAAIAFRDKWLTKLETENASLLEVKTNGLIRRIYLIEHGVPWLEQFEVERNALHANSTGPLSYHRSPIAWLPQIVHGCRNLRLKAYPAISSKKIPKAQAREFAKKAGSVLPGDIKHFRLKTRTGTKFLLAVTVEHNSKRKTTYVPFTEWCVVVVSPNVSIDSLSIADYIPKKTQTKVARKSEKIAPKMLPIATFGRSQLYACLTNDAPGNSDNEDHADYLDDELDFTKSNLKKRVEKMEKKFEELFPSLEPLKKLDWKEIEGWEEMAAWKESKKAKKTKDIKGSK